MRADELPVFAGSVGECIQTMKFLAETGRAHEAKAHAHELQELRETAMENGLEFEFFEKRTYVRLPHAEYPLLKPRYSVTGPMGAWTLDEARLRYHVHLTVELVIDGTAGGGAQLIPGDISAEFMTVPDTSEFTERPERDTSDMWNLNAADFFKKANIKNPFKKEDES